MLRILHRKGELLVRLERIGNRACCFNTTCLIVSDFESEPLQLFVKLEPEGAVSEHIYHRTLGLPAAQSSSASFTNALHK